MTDIPDVLTVAEAAAKMRLHPGQIRRRLRTGVLRGIQLTSPNGKCTKGNHWRVYADSVAEQLGVKANRHRGEPRRNPERARLAEQRSKLLRLASSRGRAHGSKPEQS